MCNRCLYELFGRKLFNFKTSETEKVWAEKSETNYNVVTIGSKNISKKCQQKKKLMYKLTTLHNNNDNNEILYFPIDY